MRLFLLALMLCGTAAVSDYAQFNYGPGLLDQQRGGVPCNEMGALEPGGFVGVQRGGRCFAGEGAGGLGAGRYNRGAYRSMGSSIGLTVRAHPPHSLTPRSPQPERALGFGRAQGGIRQLGRSNRPGLAYSDGSLYG